jgi:hypothetical protein
MGIYPILPGFIDAKDGSDTAYGTKISFRGSQTARSGIS